MLAFASSRTRPSAMSILQHTDILGFVAATFTTLSFLPQVWHSYRTRDVSGVSGAMYCLFTLGVALWVAYGIVLHSRPIVIANVITLFLALSVLGLKLSSRRQTERS